MKKFLSWLSAFVVLMLLGCGHGSSTPTPYYNAIAINSSGMMYVTDYNQKVVNYVQLPTTYSSTPTTAAASFSFSTLAGNSGTIGTADGQGTAAYFNVLEGLTVDLLPTNNNLNNVYDLYVNDLRGIYSSVRQITPSGNVTSIIGTSTSTQDCNACYASGLSSDSATAFGYGRGMVASWPKLYVVDAYNQGLVQYDLSTSPPTVSSYAYFYGVNATLCASGALPSNYSCAFGLASNGTPAMPATHVTPATPATSPTVFFATINQTVQMLYQPGATLPFACQASTSQQTPGNWTACVIAGTWSASSPAQGYDAQHLNYPDGIAYDPTNHVLYVADSNNNAIRIITSNGTTNFMSVLSGSSAGTAGLTDDASSTTTCSGTATNPCNGNTLFSHPVAIAFLPAGSVGCNGVTTHGCLYVTDQTGQRIRLVDAVTGNTWTVY